jgi:hypothetical protein
MSHRSAETVYFTQPGESNTETTLRLAQRRAEALGIRSVVVASTRGGTGVKVTELFAGCNVVVVPHHTGYKGPDVQELTPENRAAIQANGGHVLITSHALGSIGRAVRRKFNTYQVDEIIAATLKIFGQGTKVVVEIAIAAADAGLVSVTEDVVAIGGSGRGADTALVLQPANVFDFFTVKVKELICKPRL